MKKILFALLILATSLHAGSQSLEKPFPQDVVLLTVPKSGSHMMRKLFYLVYGVKKSQGLHLMGTER